MGMYTQSDLQLLCDLVNRDNPDLPKPFSPQNVALNGSPIARVANGRNTQATFVGVPGQGLSGKFVVYYDRLALSSLFGLLPTRPTISVPKTLILKYELLPYLNEELGLNLKRSDLQDAEYGIGTIYPTETPITITAGNGSFIFTGSLTFNVKVQPYGYYPDSGPGPKSLVAGDATNGYFGKFSTDELFTSAQVLQMLYPDRTDFTGMVMNSISWLKFVYLGKILYIPTQQITNLTWNEMYLRGLIYGIDGTAAGNYPSELAATNQYPIWQKKVGDKLYGLQPRLTNVSDPFWAFIMQIGSGAIQGVWGKEPDFQATNQYATTTWVNDKGYYRGFNVTNVNPIVRTSAYYWMPIVYLVDLTGVALPLTGVTTQLSNVGPVPSVTSSENTDYIQPVWVEELESGFPTSPTSTVDNPDYISPVGIDEFHSTAPPSVPMRLDQEKPPVKINLSTTNGELAGF